MWIDDLSLYFQGRPWLGRLFWVDMMLDAWCAMVRDVTGETDVGETNAG